MSDHLSVHAAGQALAGGLAGQAEVIPWGSVAAQEAVNRVCQQVTARCEQVIAAQAAADTPDLHTRTRTSPAAESSPEADEHQP